MKLQTACLCYLLPSLSTGFLVQKHSLINRQKTSPLRNDNILQQKIANNLNILRTKRTPTTRIQSSRKDDIITEAAEAESKSSVDFRTRKKLVAESIAPWRTLRLFLYGSLGSGAALGGFITAAGVAAALSGARNDVDLNTEYLNLAIDFGAVLVFVALAKFDYDKGAALNQEVEAKIEQKKERATTVKSIKAREATLGGLTLSVQTGADGTRTEATISAIQAGARQNVILIAGSRKACKDALLGANLLKLDFSMSNVLVVVYEIGEDRKESESVRPAGGFGEKPTWETQPYVAQAVGEGWESYINSEMEDAIVQNGPSAKEQGIAIVLANTGKVIRRGVGKVPWRQMVEQLAEEIAPTAKVE